MRIAITPGTALSTALALSCSILGPTASQAASAPSEETREPWLGHWSATLEHAGQRETMAIELARGDANAVVARLWLPSLDLRGVSLGPVGVDGDALRAGPFELTWDASREVLRGVLPKALVPVVEIPFELRRSGPPEPPASAAASDASLNEPVWSHELGSAVWAGLVTAGGRVFVGADDGTVSALSAVDGSRLWRARTNGRVRARPTLAGDLVLVHSDGGFLYALRAEDGAEAWRSRLGPPSRRKPLGAPQSRYEHFASAPIAAGERLWVANSEGELLCLRSRDGTVLWRFPTGDSISSTPALSDGRVFVGSFDHHVYAVDAEDGSELWRRDTGAPVVASPVVAGGRVFVGGRSYDFLALDAATGAILWSRYFWFSWVEATAAVHGDAVHVGLSDGQLVTALDVRSGEERWRFDSGGSIWSELVVAGAAPAGAADSPGSTAVILVPAVGVPGYFVEHRGGLFALDPDTGRELWRYPVEPPADDVPAYGFAAAPAADGSRVFAATVDGRVVAFDLGGPAEE